MCPGMRTIKLLLCVLLLSASAAPARADGRGLEIAGATLTGIGGASLLAGLGVMANDIAHANDRAPGHCGCAAPPFELMTLLPIGGSMLIAGLPMLIVGYKRAHKAQGNFALAPNQLALHF